MSENPHNDSRQYEDEISLYDLYRILAEKKAILISTIIITLLAAIAYLYIVPPTYEAKLRLLLPKPSTLALSMP
ncbi:MAG: Wzz/FepE/Etk N-terminal domain-containing protein, partial [Gammaproteobacteria bacterium]